MRRIDLRDWDRHSEAYVWVETGDGSLERIAFRMASWWLRTTDGRSWCSCPTDSVYLFDSAAERDATETEMRARLRGRRMPTTA